MRVKADIEVLRQIPLFADADAGHLQLLAFSTPRIELESGNVLFQKGSVGGAAYLVLGGTAEIYEDAEAAGKIIATAESGALLGELAMLANAAYGVTVKTTSPFVAKRIERELFIRLAHEFPEFGAAIMRNIVTRLGRSVAALVQVKAMFEA